MDLYQAMRVFVAVVEAGSMTAAADRHEISPTMVGNHLRALETHLGVSLLQRTTRSQHLTEAGSAYYRRCVDILGRVAEAERDLQDAQRAPQGLLRITAPPTFGSECLMPALARYLAQHPAVRVEVVLGDRRVDLVEEGFDAAFRLGTLGIDSASLVARPLRDYGLHICAAPDYLQRRGVPRSPADLAAHECLAFAYPAGTEWRWSETRWRLNGPEGEVAVEVASRLSVNHAQGLRQAALSGAGLAMLPDVLVGDDIAAGRLHAVLGDYHLPVRPMHLLYLRDRHASIKLRSFVDFALAAFAG